MSEALTVRLSEDQANDLKIVSLLLDKTSNDVIREALAAYVEPFREQSRQMRAILDKVRKEQKP